MDAFEQVKNSGKSSKKSANAEVVINSNDKGLRMMNFVHELQVYNNVEKNKQLLDEVEHDLMNYQNRGLCYLPKPKAEVDNTDTRV